MAAPAAKTREPEEHQGCTGPAANHHQRRVVEPIGVIVQPWPGHVRSEMDPLMVILAVEPEGPDTFHDRGTAATVRELIGEALWAGVQRIDEAIPKFSGDGAVGEWTKGNEYRLSIFETLSHQRQDLVRIVEIVARSTILQRAHAYDQRIELASNDGGKMRLPNEHKSAR